MSQPRNVMPARNRLRRTLLAATALYAAALSETAIAGPLNGSSSGLGVVTNVQQTSGASAAATLTSTTTGPATSYVIAPNAHRTIIDWSSFSLAATDSLAFTFATRSDIALNRIASGTANIDGVLKATVAGAYGGNVWFTAPGGVVFGSGAAVDVGGLLATASPLSMTDSAFLASADTDSFSFGAATAGASATPFSLMPVSFCTTNAASASATSASVCRW